MNLFIENLLALVLYARNQSDRISGSWTPSIFTINLPRGLILNQNKHIRT